MQEEQYYIGSDLKFKIDITALGFDQNTDEYKIDLYCGGKKISYTNADIKTDEVSGDHYLLVNTDKLTSGPMKIVVTACVQDEIFDSGVRREVDVKSIGALKKAH